MAAVGQMLLALALVIGVLWLLARLARKPMHRRGGDGLTVLTRTQLTRGACVAVVRVDGRALVLGVTDNGVTLLREADAALFAPTATTHRTPIDLDSTLEAELDDLVDRSGSPVAAGPGLAGSVLSPATWRQAAAALRSRSAGRR